MYKKPNILRDFFSFSGRVTAVDFWSSFAISAVISFAVMIVACIVVSVAVPGEVEDLSQILNWILAGVGLIWAVRILILNVRRLRDGGFTAKSFLWLLIPGFGWVYFIARRLCAPSKD